MSRRAVLLALDFGGTKLAAGIARPDDPGLVSYRRIETPRPGNPEQSLPLMRELATSLLAEDGSEPTAIGCSFGGPILDRAHGRVRSSMHLPGWDGLPLGDWLEEAFGVPAVVENDANAAAIGELRFGAGEGAQSMLYVTVSTGIGAGIILDGALQRGRNHLAGELGHLKLALDGPRCTCGGRGCLETFAAGPAIARRARSAVGAAPGDATMTAEEVSLAAQRGDEVMAKVILACAADLGRGISDAVNLLNPDLVVLGGGVLKSGDSYFEAVRTALEAAVVPGITVEVRRSRLGDAAPLLGAASLATDAVETAGRHV